MTHLKGRAKNKSGIEVEGHNGGLRAVPPERSRVKTLIRSQGVKAPPPLKLTTFCLYDHKVLHLYPTVS